MLRLEDIKKRLRRIPEGCTPNVGIDAAVALVLRYGDKGPEVLLMQRTECEGDPWTGHVSLPGGKAELDDKSLLLTAERESYEELGVDLAQIASPIGCLEKIRPYSKTSQKPLLVSPFVFLTHSPVSVTLGPEAASFFWLPLKPTADGDFDAEHLYQSGSQQVALPCWNYAGYTVWGMTYRVIQNLLLT